MNRPGQQPEEGPALEERIVFTASHRVVALYVDRVSRQWVVRDSEGSFWTLPPPDNAWDRRQPFALSEGTELEAVPGHYRYMLGLPS